MKNNILMHITYLKKKVQFQYKFLFERTSIKFETHEYINVHFTEYRLKRVGVNY